MNATCCQDNCSNIIEYQTTDQHGLFIKCCCSLHIRHILSEYDQPFKAKLYKINKSNGDLVNTPNLFSFKKTPLCFELENPTDIEYCSICLDYLVSNCVQLAFCRHYFHKECITKWCFNGLNANKIYRSEKKCPVCRGGIIMINNN